MARPKRVIRVKLFRRWFIIYDCIKFRLILSKLPARLQSAREHGQDALAGAEAAFGHLCAAHIMITTLTRLRGADAAMGQVQAAVNQIQPHGGALLNMLVLVSLVAQPDARIQI
jgi:hypothetical protein